MKEKFYFIKVGSILNYFAICLLLSCLLLDLSGDFYFFIYLKCCRFRPFASHPSPSYLLPVSCSLPPPSFQLNLRPKNGKEKAELRG